MGEPSSNFSDEPDQEKEQDDHRFGCNICKMKILSLEYLCLMPAFPCLGFSCQRVYGLCLDAQIIVKH